MRATETDASPKIHGDSNVPVHVLYSRVVLEYMYNDYIHFLTPSDRTNCISLAYLFQQMHSQLIYTSQYI
jgi:hypothetical protein